MSLSKEEIEDIFVEAVKKVREVDLKESIHGNDYRKLVRTFWSEELKFFTLGAELAQEKMLEPRVSACTEGLFTKITGADADSKTIEVDWVLEDFEVVIGQPVILAKGDSILKIKYIERKLAKAIEALEFYADFNSWMEADGNNGIYDQIKDDGVAHTNGYNMSGKRAREALKECKEKV